MTMPYISAYAAAFIGVFQIMLMMTVGFARRTTEISLGDGGNEALLLKIRRHGNLTENAPMFLILLGLLEVTGGPQMALIGFAAVFILARLSHAYALSAPNTPAAARGFGAMGTLIGIVGTAGTLAWHITATS